MTDSGQIEELPNTAVQVLRDCQQMVKVVRETAQSETKSEFLEAAKVVLSSFKTLNARCQAALNNADEALAQKITSSISTIQDNLSELIKELHAALSASTAEDETQNHTLKINMHIVNIAEAIKAIITHSQTLAQSQTNGPKYTNSPQTKPVENTSKPTGTQSSASTSNISVVDMAKVTSIARGLSTLSEIFIGKNPSISRSIVGQVAADITKNSFELQVLAKSLGLAEHAVNLKMRTTSLLTCVKAAYTGNTDQQIAMLDNAIKAMATALRDFVRSSVQQGAHVVNSPSVVPPGVRASIAITAGAVSGNTPISHPQASTVSPPEEVKPAPTTEPSAQVSASSVLTSSTTSSTTGDDEDDSEATEQSVDDDPENVIDDILDTLDDAFADLDVDDCLAKTDNATPSDKQPPLQKSNSSKDVSVTSSSPATDSPRPVRSDVTASPVSTPRDYNASPVSTPRDSVVPSASTPTLPLAASSPRTSSNPELNSPHICNTADKVRKLIGDTKTDSKKKKGKTASALKAFFQEVTEKSNISRKRPTTISGDTRVVRRDPTIIANLWDTLERDILATDFAEAQARNRWEENNQKKQEREQVNLEDEKSDKGVGALLKRVQTKLAQSTQTLRKQSSLTLASMKRLYESSFVGTKRNTHHKEDSSSAAPSSPSSTSSASSASLPSSPSSLSSPRLTHREKGLHQSQRSTIVSPSQLIVEEVSDPRAALFEAPDTDANIRLDDNTVTAGTPIKLVQRLTHDSYPDPNYVNTFLLTYKTFLPPKELLKLIEIRWDCNPPPGEDMEHFKATRLYPIRLRIYNVLKTWIEKFFYDFTGEDGAALLEQLEAFIKKMERTGLSAPASNLAKLLQKKKEGEDLTTKIAPTRTPPTPFIPKEVRSAKDFHPFEIARQLTLAEYKLFHKIKPHELLDLSWTRQDKEKRAPNVLAMIRFTNHVINWIITEILSVEDPKERAVMLHRFIIVGQKCIEMNNFNGAMEVLSALRSSSTYRLQSTWNLLTEETWIVYEHLESLFEPDDNFKAYRTALERCIPPCVPYLGRYLSDLLFIEEKLPNVIEGTDLINFSKLDTISGVIQHVQMQQEAIYVLTEVESIINYITSAETFDEKKAYQISLQLEARKTK